MLLLVDDDLAFRDSLAWLLRDNGYEVLAYGSPAAVPPLESLAGVTALIVDYLMAGEDGISFADRFHLAYPDTPIIMLTVSPGYAVARKVDARPHITLRRKPIGYDTLLAALPAPRRSWT